MELKKVRRKELLEMLLEQRRRADVLEEELAKAREELNKREIDVSEAGTIAEASMKINGLFASVQAAADQYLESIKYNEVTQKERLKREEAEAKQHLEQMEAETKLRCEQLVSEAKRESRQYWNEVSSKLDRYYAEHKGLQEILTLPIEKAEKIEEKADLLPEAFTTNDTPIDISEKPEIEVVTEDAVEVTIR